MNDGVTYSGFVVRPFNVKTVTEKKGRQFEIDFEKVHTDLIEPAMKAAGIKGDTTGEIARAGNIRTDMFQMLATAHIVVADMSIHNANVFYELGARHALRDRRTFLIRCRGDDVPFDLKTDRYMSYDQKNPGASVDALTKALKETLEADVVDSPIFDLLPELQPPDVNRLVPVPEEFQEQVNWAVENNRPGRLALLSEEASHFPWAQEGMRLVGRPQSRLQSWESARFTWEGIRRFVGTDLEADIQLGTIYQRLGDLAKSDSAIDRALRHPDINSRDRAETFSLKASNAKSRWGKTWQSADKQERCSKVLHSRYLKEAQELYAQGFGSDLNHYYSGINALALNCLQAELAKAMPDVWADGFDTDREAAEALESLIEARKDLEGAVALSVAREQKREKAKREEQRWADITAADLKLLTLSRPKRVATAYREAMEGAQSFFFDSVCRQLSIYEDLNVFAKNVKAVFDELAAVDKVAVEEARRKRKGGGETKRQQHVLLFAGHRIDAPARRKPRFPADKESVARDAIKQVIETEAQRLNAHVLGIAGGASGGDILFHEACGELGIDSELYLAIPPADYINESVRVEDAPQWIDRFRAIETRSRVWQLADSKELPTWLRSRDGYDIWKRNNLWTLYSALEFGGANVTVIVLWDGEEGDGPGGTKDMVQQAEARGAKVVTLKTKGLFQL